MTVSPRVMAYRLGKARSCSQNEHRMVRRGRGHWYEVASRVGGNLTS
jgi:hypothetical protein